VISSTNNTLQVVNIKNDGTAKYAGAYEQREVGDSPSVARYGDLFAQGDTKVHTVVNNLSGTKNVGPYTPNGYVGSDNPAVSAIADQNIDGATDAQNNGYAFTDVRVIDAKGFQGNLKFNAILTANVVDKYLNLKDGAPAQAHVDNVTFLYDLGDNATGDVFDLAISAANLAAAGTTTREDFILQINGNGGNDVISTAIYQPVPATGPGTGTGTDLSGYWDNANHDDGLELADADGNAPWYSNSKLNANLSIDAGAGNDVINTFGSGDWTVKLGTGSDTYYADNTDTKAAWVFNTADQDGIAARNIGALVSGDNADYILIDKADGTYTAGDLGSLYGLKLRVVYKDVAAASNARPDSPDGQGTFFSRVIEVPGSSNNKYVVTDLSINQAIKDAINNDPVLSKLLVAKDGPANTLVVTALSDGNHLDASDLQVEFSIPAAVATTDVAALAAAIGARSSGTGAWTAANLQAAREAAFSELLLGTTGWTTGTAPTGLNDYGPNPTTAGTGNSGWYIVEQSSDGYRSAFGTDGSAVVDGGNSDHVSDNTIYVDGAASDKDVVVLSTGEQSNDTLVWNGTFNNGTVTVVNFDSSAKIVTTPAENAVLVIDLGTFGDQVTDGVTYSVTLTGGLGAVTTTAVTLTGGSGTLDATNAAQIASAIATAVGLADTSAWTVGAVNPTNGQFTLTRTVAGDTSISAVTAVTTSGTGDLTTSAAGTVTNSGVDEVSTTALGEDYLDFTAYGATWLGVATLDASKHVTTWDVGGYANGADSTGTSLPSSVAAWAPGEIRELTKIHAGDKYITLTRENPSASNLNESTLYKVELWTVVGATAGSADAYATTSNDTVQVIGYVDVGRVIDTFTDDANSVLANIIF
jgi:hypothetical protein